MTNDYALGAAIIFAAWLVGRGLHDVADAVRFSSRIVIDWIRAKAGEL